MYYNSARVIPKTKVAIPKVLTLLSVGLYLYPVSRLVLRASINPTGPTHAWAWAGGPMSNIAILTTASFISHQQPGDLRGEPKGLYYYYYYYYC